VGARKGGRGRVKKKGERGPSLEGSTVRCKRTERGPGCVWGFRRKDYKTLKRKRRFEGEKSLTLPSTLTPQLGGKNRERELGERKTLILLLPN